MSGPALDYLLCCCYLNVTHCALQVPVVLKRSVVRIQAARRGQERWGNKGMNQGHTVGTRDRGARDAVPEALAFEQAVAAHGCRQRQHSNWSPALETASDGERNCDDAVVDEVHHYESSRRVMTGPSMGHSHVHSRWPGFAVDRCKRLRSLWTNLKVCAAVLEENVKEDHEGSQEIPIEQRL